MNNKEASFMVVCFVSIIVQGQQCLLPEDLQQSNWTATGIHSEGDIEFGSTTMGLYDLSIFGNNIDAFTCVQNITSDGIYVFRSDRRFLNTAKGFFEKAYLCMRLKKITNNLYTFYILADFVTGRGEEDRYLPLRDVQYTAITSTCELCQVLSPETDEEYSLLTRAGTMDQVPSDYVFKNCPCGTPTTQCPVSTRKKCHSLGKK